MLEDIRKFYLAWCVIGGRAKSHEKKGVSSPVTRERIQSHHQNALATMLIRRQFLRESFYSQRRVIHGLIIVTILQMLVICGLMFRKDHYQYFSTDTTGRIQALVPLDSPIQTTDYVLDWTAKAYVKAHSFNFANYQEAFEAMRSVFTAEGYQEWKTALKDAEVFKRMIREKLVSTAVIQGAPILYSEGKVGQRYQWIIEIPLLVTYQSSGQLITQNVKSRIRVVRSSQAKTPSGLVIEQILEKGK